MMFNEIFPIVSLIVGLIIGGAAFWRLGKSTLCSHQLGLLHEQLKVTYQQLQIDNAALTERCQSLIIIDQQKEKATADKVNDLESRLAGAQAEIKLLSDALLEQEKMLAKLNIAQEKDIESHQNAMKTLMQAKDELKVQFQDVATQVLEDRTKQLHAQQILNLGNVLNPLKTKLDEFQKRVETTHQEGTKDRAMLASQVEMLTKLNQLVSEETKNLTRALKGESKTQGVWGEIILERVLEISGLTKGREYDTQVSGQTVDMEGVGKDRRPDVILHMPPGNRHLVIDAKASLTAFERFSNVEEESEKQIALKQHLESIRRHMTELSNKNYQSIHSLNTVDYVIMFVPIEAAFLTAISADPKLYQDAWQKHVLLVCPSTLLFVLRMIDALWRQEKQKDNAEEILKKAEDLYDKFHGFYQSFEGIGEKLSGAHTAYEKAKNQLTTGRGNLYGRIEALATQKLISPKKSLARLSEVADVSDDGPDQLTLSDQSELDE